MISGEADGQEQSKGLSKCITSSRASQFRLYANVMSFAEAGSLYSFEYENRLFQSGGFFEAERN